MDPLYQKTTTFVMESFGGKDAYYFELIGNLVDWLFANKVDEVFRMPNVDQLQLQKHRLQENYSY